MDSRFWKSFGAGFALTALIAVLIVKADHNEIPDEKPR